MFHFDWKLTHVPTNKANDRGRKQMNDASINLWYIRFSLYGCLTVR